MATIARRVQRRIVDTFGMVGCPRLGRDVGLDACLACRDLVGAVRDADGEVVEIRCRAASRAGTQPAGVWLPFTSVWPPPRSGRER